MFLVTASYAIRNLILAKVEMHSVKTGLTVFIKSQFAPVC